MTTPEDLVGYELEEALEICRQHRIEPVLKVTGGEGKDGIRRVVRQQLIGGRVALTHAEEIWL